MTLIVFENIGHQYDYENCKGLGLTSQQIPSNLVAQTSRTPDYLPVPVKYLIVLYCGQ